MKSFLLLTFCFFLSFQSGLSAQTRYYVNQSVAASGNGLSWAGAFKTIQEAIDLASPSVSDEIWVAKGTYYPTKHPFGYISEGSREATFYISKNVRIYGGFKGDEIELAQRNWTTQLTTLSGDINTPGDSTDNAYHVLVISGTEAAPLGNGVVIDGFGVTAGNAYTIGGISVNGVFLDDYDGGGIYNLYASPTLNNLEIYNNAGFVGAGIHNHYSSPLISNCVIRNNGKVTASSGGGIYNHVSSARITNSTIKANASSEGGGITCINYSDIVCENVIFSDNLAARGGALYASSYSKPAFRNSTFSANSANIEGGAICTRIDAELTFREVKFLNNKADFGGAMKIFRTKISYEGGEFTGNEARSYGGAMFNDGGDISISNVQVSENIATRFAGGAFYNVQEVVFRLSNSTLSNNYSKREGAGIYSYTGSTLVVDHVDFTANQAGSGGGGIYMGGVTDQSSVTNSNFIGNTANSGAGIECTSSSPVLKNLVFESNIAGNSGGGVLLGSWSAVKAKRLTFKNNQADYGGGLAVLSSSPAELTDLTLTGNTASIQGGGITISSDAIINRAIFKGNTSDKGGGIYIYSCATVLTNVLVTGNRSVSDGGGIYIDRGNPVLTNLTVAGNAGNYGGGIYAGNSPQLKIRNSVISGNSDGLGFVNGLPAISYCMIQDRNVVTNNNVAAVDPQFVAPVDPALSPFINGDFALKTSSPLLDKGNSALYQTGATPDLAYILGDVINYERLVGEAVDLGAFESGGASLPVTLLRFNAEKVERNVVLSWQTSYESNSNHFEITRSLNGKDFQYVGRIQAKGESNSVLTYSFEDKDPLDSRSYYRLKMIDHDSSFAFSRIVTIAAEMSGLDDLTIYPNPATGPQVEVSYLPRQDATFRLFDLNGAETPVQISRGFDSQRPLIDISSLRSGTYLLQYQSGQTTVTKRLVVQH